MNYLKSLQAYNSAKINFAVGLMSGTSADAVDGALVKFSQNKISLEKFISLKYQKEIQDKILNAQKLSLSEISELNFKIAENFADCAEKLLTPKLKSPLVIGSHGQTVFHHSKNLKNFSTLQLGAGDIISARCNAFVVSDFRIRDMAHGGEGAPLTPYADRALYSVKNAVICNIGGISNITILENESIKGFDVGPGNAPLDRITKLLTKGAKDFDESGLLARSGSVNSSHLKKLLSEDSFISLLPPKSTGTEKYGDEFVEKIISLFGSVSADMLATAVEFIATAISLNIKNIPETSPLILAGGGSQNTFLVERIKALTPPRKVSISDEFGVPFQARECMAFAVLARDFILGKNTSLPSVTGAQCSAPLGKLTLPHNFDDLSF